MEEVKRWIDDWGQYCREPTAETKEKLLKPIQSNDTVLNEILAKEIVNNHLVSFAFHLVSTTDDCRFTITAILTCLCQSSSPYCRRLAAMCVSFVLLLEWATVNGKSAEEHGKLAGCLETIFCRQEQAIHPMPPTVRIPAIENNPPREITRLSQYFSMGQEVSKCPFTAVSRLPFTLRLCLLFVDYASDAPKECVLVFNLCWIVFLSSSVPSFKYSESVLAEISDVLSPQQARDLTDFLLNKNWPKAEDSEQEPLVSPDYTAINEDIIVMLLEWIPFAMERCPATSKALYTLSANRAKSEAFPSALLILST